MNTTAHQRMARLRAIRSGLYLGVAMAIGLTAAPSFAQTDGGAQASDPQAENAALKQENAALRAQLAALQRQQQGATPAFVPANQTQSVDSRDLAPAPATDPGGGDDRPGEHIVVTGARAAEAKRQTADLAALKDVPQSVSVVTPEELKVFDEVSLPDALSRLANIRWNDGNPRTGSFSLRGLTASAGSDTIDPSVGLTVDGVPYASLALADLTDTLDIEQINVYKGPQGTQGARQTDVGQINIVNRHPSFSTDFSASVTVGENNALRTEFEGGGTVVKDLIAFRITASRDTRDGNWWNQYAPLAGYQSYPNVDRTYGRIQLLFTPASNLSLRLKYDISPNGGEYINGLSFYKQTPQYYSDGAAAPGNPAYTGTGLTVLQRLSRSWFTADGAFNPQQYYSANPTLNSSLPITTGGHGALADLEWTLGKQNISFISSYNNSYFLAGNDDGTQYTITSDGGYITTYEQYTEQLKVNGVLANGLVDYVAGLFYLSSDSNSLSRTLYGSDWGAYNASNAQYKTLDATATGQLLMSNAANYLYTGNQSYLHNISKSAFVHLDWHVTPKLTITTGGRISHEKRELTEGALILDQGIGNVFNPVASDNVALGGTTAAALAAQLASQYLGSGYTAAQYSQFVSQVSAAQALRSSAIGKLYNLTPATPWEGNLYTAQASVRYDVSSHLTPYATFQYGEKPGLPVFIAESNGPEDITVAKERTTTYEIGLRANALNNRLVVNADIYRANIWNFQQSVELVDPVATQLAGGVTQYASYTGGVPDVRTQGVEAQIDYNGIQYLNLRATGAYTDAKYIYWATAAQPSEVDTSTVTNPSYSPYHNVSGQTLPNAPKWQGNAAATYRRPINDDLLVHSSLGFTYTSRQNVDAALSQYGWTHAYGITDFSVGLGRIDGKFDVNVIARNLFNVKREDQGWSTLTVYQKPRWIGVSLSTKLGHGE